ncbi:hypothetical protein CPB83DRAFT_924551 [Crepidotus variabilis]|uniref:F-box domain-containing protein n=1 Tax=Crepidotus variabilis TaxID=179855 RepID=A0A9P6ES06_9AGAR|nr:hypothetical protein CPB83DRAFT_924551 [Crepidotus variabilis]
MVWESSKFRNPNLFPCVLSRVCQQWAQVVAQYPHFWTRVALDISSKEPLPLGAFRWSKNHSFQAVIYHSGYSKESSASVQVDEYALVSTSIERNRAQAIKEALAPHLGRCTSLEYDVLLASSLPDLPDLLQRNPMPNIEVLKLDCRTFAIILSETRASLTGTALTPFRNMKKLKLPVATFLSIGRLDSHFWRLSKRDFFCRIELYHYEFFIADQDSLDNSDVTSVAEFVKLLVSSKIPNLQLDNVSVRLNADSVTPLIDPLTTGRMTSPRALLRLISFTLKNSSTKFLDEFFRHCLVFADFAEIDSCVLSYNARNFDALELTLANMRFNANMQFVMTRFSGHTIRFKSCPSLDDWHLRLLCNTDCDIFQDLYIEDCEGYSIQELKNLVITREENREEAGADTERDEWEVVTRMATIDLKGTGPKPSSEDAAWFTEHLETFKYDSDVV